MQPSRHGGRARDYSRNGRYAGRMSPPSDKPPGSKRKGPRAAEEVARSESRGLAGLLARARALDALDRELAAALDPRHAPHVRVANVRDGTVILATPVAPIAQRLKMETPRLLEVLERSHPGKFRALKVVVTPDLPARDPGSPS